MDRLQSMRVFQRVAEEGGFADAARKLDLDPAVVTRLVADLEQHLGARLLQRTTRRVSLTAAGEEYLARLHAILGEIDEADASVRSKTKELRGRLRILALPVVCTHMLAPAIAQFRREHADIQVELRSLDMAEPPLEDYDLTFINSTAALPADVVTREVAASDATLYASPAYLKRNGTPKKPADLARHPMLQLRLGGSRIGRLRLVERGTGQEQEVEIAPVLVSDLADPLLRATLEGVGIGSTAKDIAAPYVKAGFLVPVLPQWVTGQLVLLAVYPSRKFLPARARVFLDHFIAHLQRLTIEA